MYAYFFCKMPNVGMRVVQFVEIHLVNQSRVLLLEDSLKLETFWTTSNATIYVRQLCQSLNVLAATKIIQR